MMSDGATGGLHFGDSIKKQVEERVQREKERFKNMDPTQMGKEEKTVYRDKRGMCSCEY